MMVMVMVMVVRLMVMLVMWRTREAPVSGMARG